MRKVLLFLIAAAVIHGATPNWLDRVAAIITPAEKKMYLALPAEQRQKFEETFWTNKSITAEEYFTRVQYVDSTFGSGKAGSGANTDQGRVYLAIGPPTKVNQFASSRIFVPMEIWYYDAVPGILNTELRLVFYQKNDVGFPRLYSPNVDTIRALFLPEAATAHMFGPNDSTNESDIRQNLIVPPTEEEVIEAAAAVARGITAEGNDQILGLVASPSAALSRSLISSVHSRVSFEQPTITSFETLSPQGTPQVDLMIEVPARERLAIEVQQSGVTVLTNETRLHFDSETRVRYQQRLDLLPGAYTVLIHFDDHTYPYALNVVEAPAASEILVGELTNHRRPRSPFEFSNTWIDPTDEGHVALIQFSQPGEVTWRLRSVLSILWSVKTPVNSGFAVKSLELKGLPPGTYSLEASSNGETRDKNIRVTSTPRDLSLPEISYNANLAPEERLRTIGHQWLLRGNVSRALESLTRAKAAGGGDDVAVELARVNAVTGNYDDARASLTPILERNPHNADALSVLAFVEFKLQDYGVAEDLYCRALKIERTREVEQALSQVRSFQPQGSPAACSGGVQGLP